MSLTPLAPPPRRPRNSSTGRQSRPFYWHPYQQGGVGYIPRRAVPDAMGCDPAALSTGQKVAAHFRADHLFRVFEVLLDLHPGLKQAKSNMLRLTVGKGKTKFVVYTATGPDGEGDARDDALTGEAEDLLKAQPREVGGLVGMQTAFLIHMLTPGMVCLEAVPGVRGEGLRRLWPVDPLTVLLGRPDADPDADLAAYQRQSTSATPVRLRDETFYWSAVDATPQNPYGVGLFSAGFNMALADMAMNQNLRDAVRNAAWPRILYRILLERMTRYAVDVLHLDAQRKDEDGLTDLDKFIRDERANITAEVAGMNPDDNPIVSEDIETTPIPAGNFAGLSEVLQMERHRFVQSVDQLPTLMGINDGATQTYSSVEWTLQADKAEYAGAFIDAPVEWALEYHFRLQGKVVTVRAERDPVRTVDVVQEANAEATRTKTVTTWQDRGYITPDDAAMLLTGSGIPEGARPAAQDDDAGEEEDDESGVGQQGTTTEERDANGG